LPHKNQIDLQLVVSDCAAPLLDFYSAESNLELIKGSLNTILLYLNKL
jgi:hypothetical protein